MSISSSRNNNNNNNAADHEAEKVRRRCTSRQQIIEHVRKSLLYTAFDLRWVPQSATFAVVGQYPNNHGVLALYQLQKGELATVAELRLRHPLKCCTFGHNGSASSHLSSSAAAATTGAVAAATAQPPTSPSIAVGDFVGGLQLLDLERLCCGGGGVSTPPACANVPTLSAVCDTSAASIFHVPHAHDSIVNAVDGARCAGPPEIVTGGRDGAVKVWDARQSAKPVVVLQPADAARARDCWAVCFGNSYDADERVLAAGYDNGDVKLFDLRTQKMLHETNVGNGVCAVEFDRVDIAMNKLTVASLEGRVRCYDVRTLHPKLGYSYVEERVTDGTVWCARACPHNREVFMAGGGGELALCRYKYPPERVLRDADGLPRGVAGAIEELNTVKVGDQPINALDWNASKEGLLACASFDQSVRVMLVTKLSLVT